MNSQDEISWELAGFVEENGRLGTLQGYPEILIPPRIDVIKIGPSQKSILALDAEAPGDRVHALRYPVPKDVRLPMTRPEIASLMDAGWRACHDTSGLLNDFLELAELEGGKAAKRVTRFATKWGPLWVCHGRGWDHSGCHWSLQGGWRQYDPCSWINVELIDSFITEAREAKAVLDAAVSLRDGEPIPTDLLSILGLDFPKHFPELEHLTRWNEAQNQRTLLCSVVNRHLGASIGGPSVQMVWRYDEPELGVGSGFGFIRSAWLGIGQILADVRKLYTCDACHTVYARRMRQPKAGERNLCPKCGLAGGYRHTKLQYWRKSRGGRP